MRVVKVFSEPSSASAVAVVKILLFEAGRNNFPSSIPQTGVPSSVVTATPQCAEATAGSRVNVLICSHSVCAPSGATVSANPISTRTMPAV